VWDQVAAAANQLLLVAPGKINGSAPGALFHLLAKIVLFKHLTELQAEKSINGKAFYKSFIQWDELNSSQRNKTIFFWVSNLTNNGVLFSRKTLVEAD
jgi:hypothetical protein